MKQLDFKRAFCLAMVSSLLASCAGLETTISSPGVSLRNVTVQDLDFSGQTFLLGFDVTNPNPFPLPIKSIDYGVELDGQHFAGGRTLSEFTVGAQGDAEFAISVKLDLLRTAPQLLHIVREAATSDVPYRIKGELGIDIPLVKPVSFESSGEIRLYASQF